MSCSEIRTISTEFKYDRVTRCYYSTQLLTKLDCLNKYSKNKIDFLKIRKAIYYAKKYHENQFRDSGEPYYSHPLKVAYMASDYLFRTDIIVASILHDTIEDTIITKEIIETDFGMTIANHVADLTKIKPDRKITSDQMIESLYKQQKYDVLLIKLIDRLHNMQTLGFKTDSKIQKTATETLEFFIKPALKLGIRKVALELQKLCNQNFKQFKNKILF